MSDAYTSADVARKRAFVADLPAGEATELRRWLATYDAVVAERDALRATMKVLLGEADYALSSLAGPNRNRLQAAWVRDTARAALKEA